VARHAHSRVQEPVAHGAVVLDLLWQRPRGLCAKRQALNVLERLACGSRRGAGRQGQGCSAFSAGLLCSQCRMRGGEAAARSSSERQQREALRAHCAHYFDACMSASQWSLVLHAPRSTPSVRARRMCACVRAVHVLLWALRAYACACACACACAWACACAFGGPGNGSVPCLTHSMAVTS
jgi:hypothetical protein